MTNAASPSAFDGLTRASFSVLAERVKSLVADPFVLQIGAMDGVFFDMLHRHLMKGGWRGILVEPLPDMFAALQKTYAARPGLKLVNCAVGDHEGTLTFHRIDPEAVAKGLLPDEFLGMTTSFADKGFPSRPDFEERLAAHTLTVQAPCCTLQQLLDKQSVEKIDVVVIDAEGADWMILKQLDIGRYKPSFLCVEHSSLKPEEIKECAQTMSGHNYGLAICLEDGENMIFYKDPEKTRS